MFVSGEEMAHHLIIITQKFVLDFLDLQETRLVGDNNRIIAKYDSDIIVSVIPVDTI